MGIRIEVYVDEELADELELEDRAELADTPPKELHAKLLKMVPMSDEDIAALSPKEKQKLMEQTMKDMEKLLES